MADHLTSSCRQAPRHRSHSLQIAYKKSKKRPYCMKNTSCISSAESLAHQHTSSFPTAYQQLSFDHSENNLNHSMPSLRPFASLRSLSLLSILSPVFPLRGPPCHLCYLCASFVFLLSNF